MAAVLGQIAGTATECEYLAAAPPEVTEAADNDIWMMAAASGRLAGELGIRLSGGAARRVAQVLLGEQPDGPAVAGAEHVEAAVELFRQIAGHVATGLKPVWGEVSWQIQPSGAPAWAAAETAWLRIGFAAPLALEVRISAALGAMLRSEHADASPPAPSSSAPGHTLDRLMDVELAVTLRFGGRRMLLKDILDLCTGSVVELDQELQDPVELLLDGKPVARGEVVVVDGNYGLRVTELIAPAGN
jgi:flagellar motor switch protein FliN/FliY